MDTQAKTREISKKYFDGEAENYDRSHDGRFVQCMYEEILKCAEKLSGTTILDLGCGNGNIIRMLQDRRQGEYYGIDLSPEMVRAAKKRVGGGVDLRVGDAAALPYGDEMFDMIVCSASFHHYPEPERAVSEIRRVMKTGGSLILSDPTCPGKILRKLLNWGLHQGMTGDHRIYGKEDILPLFTRQGFEIQGWKRINFRAFIFRAVKIHESGGMRGVDEK